MALVMTSGPAGEPVSIADVKAQLRIDGTAEDLLLAGLILTARIQIEATLGLALMTQSWRLTLPAWPVGRILPLPIRPAIAVVGLQSVADTGATTALSMSGARLDPGPPPVLIAPLHGWPAPATSTDRVAVDFNAGYGPSATSVPAPLRHSILLLAAHWYEHRDPAEPDIAAAIPPAVSELMQPYRSPRL